MITTAYCATYFSLDAVLTWIGIRCENHPCTNLSMERLLSDYFTPAETALVEKARGARIDAWYYVSREVPDPFCEELIWAAPRFLVKCGGIADGMNEEKTIETLREALRKEE